MRLTSRPDVQPGGSHAPLPIVPDAELTRVITETLGDQHDSYAVVARDLAGNRTAAVNADRLFNAASLFKLLVMYEVFNQATQGIIGLDEVLELTPYYMRSMSGRASRCSASA
jgi:beta-lactamase class A